MSTEPVCAQFHQAWTATCADLFGKITEMLECGEHVLTVHRTGGNIKGHSPCRNFGLRDPIKGCAHTIFIIFDHIDHGKFPYSSHVETLVKAPLIYSRIPHKAYANQVLPTVFDLPTNTSGQRNLSSNNTMTSEKAGISAENVHRAALPTRHSSDTTIKLGHNCLRANPLCNSLCMGSVSTDSIIFWLKHFNHAGRTSFLSDMEMAEASDFTNRITFFSFFLKAPV